jgi:hypothetical protein
MDVVVGGGVGTPGEVKVFQLGAGAVRDFSVFAPGFLGGVYVG